MTQIPATKVYILFVEETSHGGWDWETHLHGVYATREKAQEVRKALAAKRVFSIRCGEWKSRIRAVPLCS